jgi:hypothetical protein
MIRVSIGCLIIFASCCLTANAEAPYASARPVTEISYHSSGTARFNGTVQPNGFDTEAWFEISTNPDFNPNVFFYRRYPSTNLSRLTLPYYSVTYLATNFVPFGTFYSRLVASNSAGISFTSNQLFTTSFSEFAPTLHAISGNALWADYNSDGRFDFLLSGWTGTSRVSRIYRNLGTVIVQGQATNMFTNSLPGLLGVAEGSAAWGDFNNDGRLDLILSGYTGSNRMTGIFRNDGDSGFSLLDVALPGTWPGSVQWADFDNDGKSDLLLAGQTDSGGIARIYRNNGNDKFTDANAPFTDLSSAIASANDFDNDGDLDVLVTGATSKGAPTVWFYRNESAWNFREITSPLSPRVNPVVTWLDYDSDGDDDVFFAGYVGFYPLTKLCQNNGNFTFTEAGANFELVVDLIGNRRGFLDLVTHGHDFVGAR